MDLPKRCCEWGTKSRLSPSSPIVIVFKGDRSGNDVVLFAAE